MAERLAQWERSTPKLGQIRPTNGTSNREFTPQPFPLANDARPESPLVDDQAIVRNGIKSLLDIASEFSICGEASDGKETGEKVLTLHPELVLMDISMLVMNGIEATKRIRLLSSGTKIVMLSMHDSPQITSAAGWRRRLLGQEPELG